MPLPIIPKTRRENAQNSITYITGGSVVMSASMTTPHALIALHEAQRAQRAGETKNA